MIEHARLAPGRGFRPLHAAFYYAQRLAVRPYLRRAVARGFAAAVRRRHPVPADRVGAGAVQAAAVEARGFVALGPVLDRIQVGAVRAWLADKPVLALSDRTRSFAVEHPPADVSVAGYALRDILDCPHLLALANRSDILAAVGVYLGCAPTISAMTLRWSWPRPGAPADLQHFHRDPDEWRFVKLIAYLTDVDEETGPHVFIAGTHRAPSGLRMRRMNDAAAARYGDAVTSMTGSAGAGFLVDTWGWHKGAVPRSRPRLMLTVQYSVLPVWAFLPRPVERANLASPPPPGLDPWINRLVLH